MVMKKFFNGVCEFGKGVLGGIFYIFFIPLIAVVVFEFFNEKNQKTHVIPPPQTPLPSESEVLEMERQIEAGR